MGWGQWEHFPVTWDGGGHHGPGRALCGLWPGQALVLAGVALSAEPGLASSEARGRTVEEALVTGLGPSCL